MPTSRPHSKFSSLPKMERMYKHILKNELARGAHKPEAERIAAATVNRHRAQRAGGGLKVSPEGERPFRTTVRVFCLDNSDDTDVCEAVRRLRPGQSVVFGGGSVPPVIVTRLRGDKGAPKLVGKGGSRRQWYPGKATAKKRHEKSKGKRKAKTKKRSG